MYVDLDELPSLFQRGWFWSSSSPRFAWFRRSDHLGPPSQSLAESVRDLVQERIGWRPDGSIRLLTHFRYGGFQMNPVSFYYCHDADSQRLAAVVAEVNNTPWNERHCYVLDVRDQSDAPEFTATQRKEFHVSPFLDMDYEYRWRLNSPSDQLALQIDLQKAGGLAFHASLQLKRVPISTWNLARVLLAFPLMTLRVYMGIHWQALLLWLKRVPYVPHPGRTSTTNQPTDPERSVGPMSDSTGDVEERGVRSRLARDFAKAEH
jgi:DUF1365 family protein